MVSRGVNSPHKNGPIPLQLAKNSDRIHKLTELLVLYSHPKVLHHGVKQTLTEFR